MAKVARIAEPDASAEVLEGLAKSLSETVVTTMKAQNFHWNVTGMAFGPLHALFQEIYEDHFAAQDEVAERIKALGGHAEGRLAEHLKASAVKEATGKEVAEKMVAALMKDQETLSKSMLSLAEKADKQGDVVTNDLAIERASVHDKFAWMLRSHLR